MTLDRDRILQSAQKYIDRKKYDRAIEEYQRVIREDPEDARTLLKIGDLQARMQAYGDAIATYDHVGQYYAKHGFAPKAIAVYKQIRELMRKHAPELADKYAHITPTTSTATVASTPWPPTTSSLRGCNATVASVTPSRCSPGWWSSTPTILSTS